jgi:hypothetical protein
MSFGTHPAVTQFFKAVFNTRMPLARLPVTWDAAALLQHLRRLHPHESLSLMQLSSKTATLLALTSSQRVQTLSCLSVDGLQLHDDYALFVIQRPLKTSRAGRLPSVDFKAFKEDRALCPVTVLRDYLAVSNELRAQTSNLFISTRRPHKAASSDTIAAAAGIALDAILRRADWSSSSCFQRFYKKPVLSVAAFNAVLQGHVSQ